MASDTNDTNTGGEEKTEEESRNVGGNTEAPTKQPRRYSRRRKSADGGEEKTEEGTSKRQPRRKSRRRSSAGGGRSKSRSPSRHRRERSRDGSADGSKNRHRSRSRGDNPRHRKERRRRRKSRHRSVDGDDSKIRHRTKSRQRRHRSKSRDRKHSRSNRHMHRRHSKRGSSKDKSISSTRSSDKSGDINFLKEQIDVQQDEMEVQSEKLQKEIIQENKKTRRLMIGCGFCLFLAAAIAAIVILIVRKNNDSSNQASLTPAGISPESPTMAPVVPSSVPTVHASAFPSETRLFFPATKEDCLAIQNKNPVSGQEDMIQRDFKLSLDVSTDSETDPNSLITDVKSSFETFIVPNLVGCIDASQRELMGTMFLRGGQHRQLIEEIYRWIIGNVGITVLYEDETCEETAPTPCYRLTVIYNLYLKGDELNVRIIEIITSSFISSSENSLIEDMGFPPPMTTISAAGVVSISPTDVPSSSPSLFPSNSPTTSMPSKNPSSVPSLLASSVPTSVPSFNPTCSSVETYFRVVIGDLDDAVDDNTKLSWDIDCNGDEGDVVVLYKNSGSCDVECVGHLQNDSYLDHCNAGYSPFSVFIDAEKGDFDGDVKIGYIRPFNIDELCSSSEQDSITLGTNMPSLSPSLSVSPSTYPSISVSPSTYPSIGASPSMHPSMAPSKVPSMSMIPSVAPSSSPSKSPT